jgi:hypothetical protein
MNWSSFEVLIKKGYRRTLTDEFQKGARALICRKKPVQVGVVAGDDRNVARGRAMEVAQPHSSQMRQIGLPTINTR